MSLTDPRLRNQCRVHPLHRAAIVGEAPGPNTRGDFPMYPYPARSAAGRLKACIEFSTREYLQAFARANLMDAYPGKSFPATAAATREAAMCIAREMAPRPLLLMGRGVATAFFLPATTPVLEWSPMHVREYVIQIAIVPHPSGRNLWYNVPANREAVRNFFAPFRAETSTDD
jgi:hypothetical protein